MNRVAPPTNLGAPVIAVAATFCSLLAACSVARAENTARWFPPKAAVHVEVNDLQGTIDQWLSSPTWTILTTSPQYSELQKEKDFRKLLAVGTIAERQLGMDLWTVARELAGRSIAAAVYPAAESSSPSAVLVARSASAEALAHLQQRIEPLLVLAEDQIRRTETLDGGLQLSVHDRVFAAWKDDWLIVSNQQQLLEDTRQRIVDDGLDTLADDPTYRQFQQDVSTPPDGFRRLAHAYVDVQLLTKHGVSLPDRLDQPLLSLLVGDIHELLRRSPYAGLTVDRSPTELSVRLTVAAQRELDQGHQAFFPAAGQPGARPLLDVEGLVAGFSLYRDFATWYQQREQLLDARVLPGFDKFETGLANILPGKDFGSDILPLMGHRLQLVAAPQSYDHLDGRPGVQLPGFGLLVELADPEEGAAMVQLFFQTLTAVLNLQAGQQGRQPWIMTTEVYHGIPISMAKYLKKPSGERLGVVFNFLPSAARVDNHFVLCSSVQLCRELIDQLQQPSSADPSPPTTLRFQLQTAELTEALDRNREFFTARMIQEGQTPEQAQSQWESILMLIQTWRRIELETVSQSTSFHVQLTGSWE